MSAHQHRRQRPFHRFRYGFAHWRKHARHEQHNHALRPTTPTTEDSASSSVGRTTFTKVRRGRRRRILTLAGFVVGVIVVMLVVAAGLALGTYSHVKDPLRSAENTLTALAHNTGGLNSAQGRALTASRLAEASREISSAQNQIDGSLGLKILGIVPGLHTQGVGLEQLVGDLHETTVNALSLVHSVNVLAAESHGTDISLPDLKQLGSVFASTRAQLTSDDRSTGMWGPLGAYRQKFDREDVRAVHLLGQGEDATQFALEFLGSDGPRDYLVMGENNAEMRDEGATLSYALLNTLHGAITDHTGGTVNSLELATPAPGVSVPAGTGYRASRGNDHNPKCCIHPARPAVSGTSAWIFSRTPTGRTGGSGLRCFSSTGSWES